MENEFNDSSAQPEINFDTRIHNITTNGFNFDIGSCISGGSKILQQNLGGYIGFIFIYLLIALGTSLVPFVGSLINSFILSPALMAGFFLVAYRIHHKKRFEFSNFFDGFKYVGGLAMLNLVMVVLILIIAVPYVIIKTGSQLMDLMSMAQSINDGTEDPQVFIEVAMDLFKQLIPLFLAIAILQMLWWFAPYIVIFGKKNFWDAMMISSKIVVKRFFHFLLFAFVLAIINIGGAMMLVVGLLYTVPLSVCAMYAAYEQIVGTNAADIEY